VGFGSLLYCLDSRYHVKNPSQFTIGMYGKLHINEDLEKTE